MTTTDELGLETRASGDGRAGLAADLAALRAELAELRAVPAYVRAEPFTYRQRAVDAHGNGISYFRDRYWRERDPAARARLDRHALEMDNYRKEQLARERREIDRLEGEGFEYRVNPNLTQGTGGYEAPPLWLIDKIATAPRPKRILAKLAPNFPLPPGCQSVNVPRLTTGTTELVIPPDSMDEDVDIVDTSTTSQVVTIAGQGDVAIQFLEMGPMGSHTDAGWWQDITEAYDYDLELQILNGTGPATSGNNTQINGLLNLSGTNSITYTSGSPTGTAMYPYFGQCVAQLGDARDLPPEVWLMRTARWAWLVTQEDSQSRPLEIPQLHGVDNPSCPGSLIGWSAWMNDAIPATFGVGGNQDAVIACRPSDLLVFESNAVSTINLEPLSGTLEARLVYRNYAAAITGRYPSGISKLTGTGMAVQSSY